MMGAMGVHHTDTMDGAWDGPAMVARLPDEMTPAMGKKMFAWMDPESDGTAKADYKMPHHMVGDDGMPGAANLKACSAVMGVLNGSRGGADIPEADRAAVARHVQAHMKDGGMSDEDMPMLKSGRTVERRAFPLAELRIDDAGGAAVPVIRGHAAVFNQLSEDMGFFRERIAPGAFAKTIQEADIRALWNHDANYVLGRNRANTLRLSEDATGLAVEIDPPDTTWARDLLATMRRGDVNQMSFGFYTVKDVWEEQDGGVVRTLLETRLFDVSPVTFPAYPQTDVAARSILTDAGLDVDAISCVLMRSRLALPIRAADRDMIRTSLDVLRELTEPNESHSAATAATEPARNHSLELLRRRLAIAELEV